MPHAGEDALISMALEERGKTAEAPGTALPAWRGKNGHALTTMLILLKANYRAGRAGLGRFLLVLLILLT
jgi:hypothetical protein